MDSSAQASPADHETYMRRCIALARQAMATRDTPVGSLVVRDGQIIAEGVESVRGRGDATAHAEMVALRAASAALKSHDLTGCTMYTTVEPCVMCAYAIRLARIGLVVSGVRSSDTASIINGYAVLTDPGVLPSRTPPMVIRDVLAAECQAVLAGDLSP